MYIHMNGFQYYVANEIDAEAFILALSVGFTIYWRIQ